MLINGSPTRKFNPGRGLRQGDPLPPLLYLIVGEILYCLIKKVAPTIFSCISLNENGEEISHLQFAGRYGSIH